VHLRQRLLHLLQDSSRLRCQQQLLQDSSRLRYHQQLLLQDSSRLRSQRQLQESRMQVPMPLCTLPQHSLPSSALSHPSSSMQHSQWLRQDCCCVQAL
jgi:hypothetical protein